MENTDDMDKSIDIIIEMSKAVYTKDKSDPAYTKYLENILNEMTVQFKKIHRRLAANVDFFISKSGKIYKTEEIEVITHLQECRKCNLCDLNGKDDCYRVDCSSNIRIDKKNVIFKKIDINGVNNKFNAGDQAYTIINNKVYKVNVITVVSITSENFKMIKYDIVCPLINRKERVDECDLYKDMSDFIQRLSEDFK